MILQLQPWKLVKRFYLFNCSTSQTTMSRNEGDVGKVGSCAIKSGLPCKCWGIAQGCMYWKAPVHRSKWTTFAKSEYCAQKPAVDPLLISRARWWEERREQRSRVLCSNLTICLGRCQYLSKYQHRKFTYPHSSWWPCQLSWYPTEVCHRLYRQYSRRRRVHSSGLPTLDPYHLLVLSSSQQS